MTLVELLNRLRDRLRRDTLAVELDEELRFHQAMLERDQRALGASPDEARRRGRRRLGQPTRLREETRDMWSLGWIDDLLHDLRYAGRVLRRNAGFTAAVVLTLALGIGANTAIFSVVNAVILRPLPYADADRLFSVWTVPDGAPDDRNPASYPDIADWQTQSRAFAGLAGYAFNRFELTGDDGRGDFARGVIATPTLYQVLGAPPLIGRLPRADEAGVPVVAISHRLWRERLGADPHVLGRRITLGEQAYTIVGVMPAGFHFPSPDIDLWLPLYPITATRSTDANPWVTARGFRGYRVVGRLRAGVGADVAEREMDALERRLGESYPESDAGLGIRLRSIRDDGVKDVRRALWLMLGAAGLVLLLACANVAHLMLARTSTRGREIAIRRALGAHRGRVVRQLLTESVLLGALGGAAGVGVAAVAMRVLVRLSPRDVPRLETVSLDAPTLAFAAMVAIATGVLFGLAPAIVAWHGGARETLRENARGGVGGQGTRVRSALTVAEVAFALVLLVGAGLMIRSFAALLARDPGFRAEGAVVFALNVGGSRYPTPEAQVRGVDHVLARLRAIPGVAAAGASTSVPPTRMQQATAFAIAGDPATEPGKEPTAVYVPTTPGFLEAIGVPLVTGRALGDRDGPTAPRVVVINRELARRHFAGRDPIGHVLQLEGVERTIVGVVGDVGYEGIAKRARPAVYVPWAQSPFAGAWFALRARRDEPAVIAAVRSAVHAADPLLTPRELRPMPEMVAESIVRPRFQTWLLATFGGLALVLAAVGIYGVIAYGVAQRTAEIGLRLALGSTPRAVIGLLLGRGMLPVLAGIALGVAAAMALSRLMTGLLVDVSPTDAATFTTTALLLLAVAVAAAWVPAARAARMDPLMALRMG